MNEVIVYLLKVIAIHGLLYLFYRLVLRNTGQHTFNRGYLILALLAAFFIPFIEISVPETIHPMDDEGSVIMWLSEPTAGIEEIELIPVQKEAANSYWVLIPWFYVGIAMILLVRSIFYLAVLSRLKRHSEYVKKPWFKLFKISQDRPFSFFSNVFMPKSLFGTDAFEQILAHECEHVRRYHSIDRLLMDFVVSLFWFNPFIYLYRNALIEIHEFQADEVVLNRFKDPVGYQEILFSQLQSAQYSGLVSHFNFSMIKKRIVMMNKKQKMSGWIYALTAPVTLMVVFAFSTKEAVEPIENVGNELAEILSPEPSFKLPTFNLPELKGRPQQEDNVPSILPLREADVVRMTSGFGKRMHPIKKVEQWHLGMDFSCPSGSEILATANGVVESIDEKPEGYGKLIIIDHGNEYKTRYAQLSEFKVKEGDQVKMGDVIALSGNSGMSTAPHLHYEVQKGDKRVNPIHYIQDYNFKIKVKEKKSEGESYGVVKQRKQDKALQEEMLIAKEEAERARSEELKANKMLKRATEEEKRAYQLQQEAEEKRQIEEKIRKEKLRFQDEKQDANGTRITLDGGNEGQNPLFVLDGEVVKNIENLSPDDIKSINVLKGESARKQYGEKGKDGVIEIFTKDKKKDKSKNKEKNKSKSKVKSDSDGPELSKAQIIKTQKIIAERGYFKPFRVIIDPGHGGKDSGTSSQSGISEKDISWEIAKMVGEYLSDDKNIEIVFTRTDNEAIDLKSRSETTVNSDLLISIHANFDEDDSKSFTGLYLNPEGFYYDESMKLARVFKDEIEIKNREVRMALADFYLLRAAKCPAVHVELGYLSNTEDTFLMNSKEGKELLAISIANGIRSGVQLL